MVASTTPYTDEVLEAAGTRLHMLKGGTGRPVSSACRHDNLRAIVRSQPRKASGSFSSPIDAQAFR